MFKRSTKLDGLQLYGNPAQLIQRKLFHYCTCAHKITTPLSVLCLSRLRQSHEKSSTDLVMPITSSAYYATFGSNLEISRGIPWETIMLLTVQKNVLVQAWILELFQERIFNVLLKCSLIKTSNGGCPAYWPKLILLQLFIAVQSDFKTIHDHAYITWLSQA